MVQRELVQLNLNIGASVGDSITTKRVICIITIKLSTAIRKDYNEISELIGYSVFFCQMVPKLSVLTLAHGMIDLIVHFVIWFLIATWGFLKITNAQHFVGDK